MFPYTFHIDGLGQQASSENGNAYFIYLGDNGAAYEDILPTFDINVRHITALKEYIHNVLHTRDYISRSATDNLLQKMLQCAC